MNDYIESDPRREIIWKEVKSNQFVAHMNSSQIGQKIYLKKVENSSHHKNVIFLFHDLCQYSGCFQSFINWALVHINDLVIYSMDYVGHGQSSGTRGHFDDFQFLVLDQLEFIQNIDYKNDQKVYYIGHGLGGLVTLDLYNKFSNKLVKKPESILLSNFILHLDHPILHLKLKNSFFINATTHHLRLIKIFDPLKLTHKADRVLSLGQDPLIVHRPTLKAILEVKNKAKTIYQDAYYLDLPIFIGWSENDPYLHRRGMNYFIKGIKKELLNEKTYSLMKHDLYNEIDSISFYHDIKNWIVPNEI